MPRLFLRNREDLTWVLTHFNSKIDELIDNIKQQSRASGRFVAKLHASAT